MKVQGLFVAFKCGLFALVVEVIALIALVAVSMG